MLQCGTNKKGSKFCLKFEFYLLNQVAVDCSEQKWCDPAITVRCCVQLSRRITLTNKKVTTTMEHTSSRSHSMNKDYRLKSKGSMHEKVAKFKKQKMGIKLIKKQQILGTVCLKN